MNRLCRIPCFKKWNGNLKITDKSDYNKAFKVAITPPMLTSSASFTRTISIFKHHKAVCEPVNGCNYDASKNYNEALLHLNQ